MGRHVGRSRRCRVCIQRRIKCDEAFPECAECLVTGRKCTGPLQGTLFVDMSEQVRQEVGKDSNGKTRKRRKPSPPVYGTEDASSALRTALQKFEPFRSSSPEYRLPTTYQPPKGNIFHQHYLAQFISSHESDLHTWVKELPSLSCGPPASTEAYAIRATSLSFYSKLTRSKDIEIEACKWYSKGLESQRNNLQLVTKNRITTSGSICAAIMLSFFESIIGTTPMGWLLHHRAAEKMLDILGPERCQSGLMFKFFRTLRKVSFTIAMTLEEPSMFASERWCTTPFGLNPKTPFDELIDILLQLPCCLPCRNDMKQLHDDDPEISEVQRRELVTTAQDILSSLDRFWEDNSEMDPSYDERIADALPAIEQNSPLSAVIPFKNTFIASFISLYDAGNLIVWSYRLAASRTPEKCHSKMKAHSASILSSVLYHETQSPSSEVSFAMIFPVKTVHSLTPSDNQKKMAADSLLMWGSKKGLNDDSQDGAPWMPGTRL